MNHDQPQQSDSEDDLFKWAGIPFEDYQSTEVPVEEPEDPEEPDDSDTCTLCKNGGFCPVHAVRPKNISELQHPHYGVKSDDDSINEELQLAANSKRKPLPDFQSREEAVAYMKQLWGDHSEDDKQKAS